MEGAVATGGGGGAALALMLVLGTVAFAGAHSWLLPQWLGLANGRLHALLFGRVLRAPLRFFDAPHALAALVDLFTLDVETFEELLPRALAAALVAALTATCGLLYITAAAPLALLALPVLGLAARGPVRAYARSVRRLKQLDRASCGPLLSLYNETLGGLPVIRAFRLQPALCAMLLGQLSRNQVTLPPHPPTLPPLPPPLPPPLRPPLRPPLPPLKGCDGDAGRAARVVVEGGRDWDL